MLDQTCSFFVTKRMSGSTRHSVPLNFLVLHQSCADFRCSVGSLMLVVGTPLTLVESCPGHQDRI